MTITCTRDIEFDAGHRVAGHESKCAHLHGHRYRVELHAKARLWTDVKKERLDHVGRVIDFSVLKERIGGWIDEHWDHRTLLWSSDPLHDVFVEDYDDVLKNSVVVVPFNPTAENIAKHLLDVVCPKLLESTTVRVYMVVVHETPNCRATAICG